MFKLNEIVFVNSLHKKAKVIGVSYFEKSIRYIVETKDEIELETDYMDLVYLSHGY